MTDGIRAEITVGAGDSCPVAETARDAGEPTLSISRSVEPQEQGRVVEEFMLDVDAGDRPDVEGMEPVFRYDSKCVYRFERPIDMGCPCEVVERSDCPVVDVHTHDGELFLVFHARDMDQLRAVVEDLRENFRSVEIQRLLRSADDQPGHSLAMVDRGTLTTRQREVLETANRMGYFDYPKGANAGEVADELGISTSTFSEHLAAAQSKLLDSILER